MITAKLHKSSFCVKEGECERGEERRETQGKKESGAVREREGK